MTFTSILGSEMLRFYFFQNVKGKKISNRTYSEELWPSRMKTISRLRKIKIAHPENLEMSNLADVFLKALFFPNPW